MSSGRRIRDESGFTLVELLVVILIIGVLSAIAVPAFMNQRQRANDAALENDMKNAALAYATWRSDNKKTNQDYRALANGSYYMLVADDNADYNQGTSTVRWNSVPELPEVNVSDGVYITFVVAAYDSATGDGWHTAHDEGEFCLVGTHPNSTYNYKAGSGDYSNYNKQLFFDSAMGGVMTMEDIAERFSNGQKSSCYLYAERFIASQ